MIRLTRIRRRALLPIRSFASAKRRFNMALLIVDGSNTSPIAHRGAPALVKCHLVESWKPDEMSVTSVIIGGDGEPEEPDWRLIYADEDDLEAACREWGQIIRELRECRTLSVENGHAIRRLVDFRIQYERASRHVAEHGPVFKSKSEGKAGQWNPYWGVMRHCEDVIRHCEAELGIAPVRRRRAAQVQKRDRAARAADAYLKKAHG
jgi:P27 family predicted phage terminase small subunit